MSSDLSGEALAKSEASAKEDWSFGGLRRTKGATGSCPWGSTLDGFLDRLDPLVRLHPQSGWHQEAPSKGAPDCPGSQNCKLLPPP